MENERMNKIVRIEPGVGIELGLYRDIDVARRLNLSAAWVRGQRFKRVHGQPHVFDVDARKIGGCVRYVPEEVEDFLARQTSKDA